MMFGTNDDGVMGDVMEKKNIYSTEELLSLIEKSPKNVEKMIENKEILNGIGGAKRLMNT